MEAPGGALRSLTRRQSPTTYVKIPTESEFLVIKSTPQGYVSWRNAGVGTRFIQMLCQVLDFEAGNERPRDLLTLLTLVNRLVSELDIDRGCEGITFKQIPEIQSTLTKLVFLTHSHWWQFTLSVSTFLLLSNIAYNVVFFKFRIFETYSYDKTLILMNVSDTDMLLSWG